MSYAVGVAISWRTRHPRWGATRLSRPPNQGWSGQTFDVQGL